jgi:hypothetical protein
MYWSNFLHIYQPAGQQPDILEMVVEQSYRPLVENLLKHDGARITLNINGSLLELFDQHGYHDLIKGLAEAGRQGKVEFTGSAKYHALMPFLSRPEMLRQIEINNETNRHYLGDAYQPQGFFLPEMAYSPEVAPVLEEAGFKWVIMDEIAHHGKVETVDYTKLYQIKGTKLHVFFRERRTSNLIMSAVVRHVGQLKTAMADNLASDRYIVTGMDGETFGHHRPGLENLLFEIFDAPELKLVKMSELFDHYKDTVTVEPVGCTWASSEQDIAQGIQFISWNDPGNPIHKLQWQLRDLTVEEFYKLPQDDPEWPRLRARLDSALASDQFFWACAKPWWSIEMIEEGAYDLLQILQHLPNIDPYRYELGESHYHQILATAFSWKRGGTLLQIERERDSILRIPFKERTLEKGGSEPGVYHAFIDLMAEQERQAAARRDYEAAVLWRDAVYKIEHKTDIYEAIHAIDLLRTKLPNDEVEQTIKKYKADYLHMRGGQPEQRGAQ